MFLFFPLVGVGAKEDIDISGTWLLYSGGKVAPDIIQLYPDGTGVTADLTDEIYYDETYIFLYMMNNYQEIEWCLSVDDSKNLFLYLVSTGDANKYELSFEYNMLNQPLILCLSICDAGGGWIPVCADNLSH